jgi:copper homeostasis protein
MSIMREILLEVCVDNVHGLAAALAGGADRIELCAALEVGGLTPSAGLMRAAAASPVPVVAMIRPRAGHFVFDAAESAVMLADIDAVHAAGLQGVVLGASRDDGCLDHRTLSMLLAHARQRGLGCTLHRAFDLCPDLAEATRTAVGLGFDRILSSGGAPTAGEGIDQLARCFDAAAGALVVMPGAGVNADTIAALRSRLPLTDVHASCALPLACVDARAVAFGFASGTRRQTSRAAVSALKTALNDPGQQHSCPA